MNENYTQVISGRITNTEREIMKAYGFTVRDAVSYLLADKCSVETKLKVKKSLIEKEIESLEQELQIKKLQHEQILIDLEGRDC